MKIKIPIVTTMDSSQLLEIIQQLAKQIVAEIETYGEEAYVHIEDIEVQG
jgi:hypothetical protein